MRNPEKIVPRFKKEPGEVEKVRQEMKEMEERLNLYSKLAENYFGLRRWEEEHPKGRPPNPREWSDFKDWYFSPGSYEEREKKLKREKKYRICKGKPSGGIILMRFVRSIKFIFSP